MQPHSLRAPFCRPGWAVVLSAAPGLPTRAQTPNTIPLFASADEGGSKYERGVAPFLARHCVEWHTANKACGDLYLTALDPNMKGGTGGGSMKAQITALPTSESFLYRVPSAANEP